MDYKEIMDIANSLDIDKNDFKDVDVDLKSFEKKRLKKDLKKFIRNGKKFKARRIKIIATASVLALCLTTSGIILSKPAFADNIDILQDVYEKMGYYKDYKDYSEFVGQTKEDNGYSFTIEKLVATPNKMLVAAKVKALNGKFTKYFVECSSTFSDKKVSYSGGEIKEKVIDESTRMYIFEERIDYGKFKKRGDIKITFRIDPNEAMAKTLDLKEDTKNVKVDFDFKVDFSHAFDKTIHKEINKKLNIGDTATYIKSMDSSILGTLFKISTYDDTKGTLLIQVDDKIYQQHSGPGFSSEGGSLYNNEITYDTIKNAKSIKLIALEKKTIDDPDYKNKKNDSGILLPNKLETPIKTNFIKNRDGEIYKIERTTDTLRVYYDCAENTLSECSMIVIHNKDFVDEVTGAPTIIVKDKNRKNGYYLERAIKENEDYYLNRIRDITPTHYNVSQILDIK
ncbi:protein of unknown function [Clostridium cavendishii DSM 21758]|uniref:DUF4179 domain-containing protein n=1 Tax=Clostridium cavendishii DSM 21758 TaxID=1121302 RepID=A0A1M6JC86_9CLOT|nr:DUF4179 domain-containing protein [Clostridium cavendishii]SHJ44311.1 protein of unknown function [Clostridium cavendishii DSM 21758]